MKHLFCIEEKPDILTGQNSHQNWEKLTCILQSSISDLSLCLSVWSVISSIFIISFYHQNLSLKPNPTVITCRWRWIRSPLPRLTGRPWHRQRGRWGGTPRCGCTACGPCWPDWTPRIWNNPRAEIIRLG